MRTVLHAGELVEIARIPRQLVLREDDRRRPGDWIPGIPRDFSGYVTLNSPDYLVEVQSTAESEDDSDSVEGNSFLVSIDCDLTVVPREVIAVRIS